MVLLSAKKRSLVTIVRLASDRVYTSMRNSLVVMFALYRLYQR